MDELKSQNALVYHISTLSQDWKITNPYNSMLRCLLTNKPCNLDLQTLRQNQEYHFIAKMIYDETTLNNEAVKKNTNKILAMIKKVQKNKQQSDADSVIRCIYYVLIMSLLGKRLHYDILPTNQVRDLLKEVKTESHNLQHLNRILCFVYNVNSELVDIDIDDDIALSLDLLYRRLILCNQENRDKNALIEYYTKQSKLDDIDLTSVSSEKTQGKLLEIAVNLKATTGNGLYIPEIEREQYLSNFTKDILRKKYSDIISKENTVSFFGLSLPIWLALLTIFLIEAVIFSVPNYVESISLGFVSISTKPLMELPISAIIAINGVAIVIYFFYRERKLKYRVSNA